jgi:hypothetical protein
MNRNKSHLTSIPIESEWGDIVCGQCGCLQLCDDSGDMPEECAGCGVHRPDAGTGTPIFALFCVCSPDILPDSAVR